MKNVLFNALLGNYDTLPCNVSFEGTYRPYKERLEGSTRIDETSHVSNGEGFKVMVVHTYIHT